MKTLKFQRRLTSLRTQQQFRFQSQLKQQQVLYKLENNVATISLNRVEKRNALGKQLMEELNDCLDQSIKDEARCLILKSESEKVFCAGADLKERKEMSEIEVKQFVRLLRSTATRIEDLDCPTIACISGGAFGGGLEMALACDMRLAHEKTSMGLVETTLAIIPGAGGTQRLPRIVGIPRAKELIYTGRRFNAEYAENIGLVNYVLPDQDGMVEKAEELAAEISKNGPVAVRVAKIAVQNGIELDRKSGMMLEEQCYAQIIPTQDRMEGLKSFAEKRKPNYIGK